MPHTRANLRANFGQQHLKHTTITRPIVRLYRVPDAALKQVSFSSSGVRPGERLVLWIDPDVLVSCTEADLLDALHAVIKRLRDVRDASRRPSDEALEVYRLKEREGLSVARIAKRFEKDWPDCSDVESRERRVKRHLRKARAYLARAEKRELASRTARERAIVDLLKDVPPVEPMAD
jgi:hypothetical protein